MGGVISLDKSYVSKEIYDELIVNVPNNETIIVHKYDFLVKPSTMTNAGLGLFADMDIPFGTVIFDLGNGSLTSTKASEAWYINDLAYRRDQGFQLTREELADYCTNSNIDKNTNVGYKRQILAVINIYIYAKRDIKKGEELSKFYGPDYWAENEFWRSLSTSKYRMNVFITEENRRRAILDPSANQVELPDRYVFVDYVDDPRFPGCCRGLSLLGKRVNDRYYYIVAYGKYYEPGFEAEKTKLIEQTEQIIRNCGEGTTQTHTFRATKPDFSMYHIDTDEKLPNGMQFKQYLDQKGSV